MPGCPVPCGWGLCHFSGKPDHGKVCDKFDSISLDYFCDSRSVEHLDLIKSDVDGWDYELLLGAKESIRRFRPIVIAELNHSLGWRKHSKEDVKHFLDEIGYVHEVLDNPFPTNWLMQSKDNV